MIQAGFFIHNLEHNIVKLNKGAISLFDSQIGLDKDLQLVQQRINEKIMIKTEGLHDLVPLSLGEMDRLACPAILLAVNQACGDRADLAIDLATAVELIYLADKVHKLIRDTEFSEEETQYPVLVGDFLYGQYFQTLCQAELLQYLAPLSNVIEVMNKGSIEYWRTVRETVAERDVWLRIADQVTSSITETAAGLGADLAGASVCVREQMESLGRNLGRFWAVRSENQTDAAAQVALDQAEQIIQGLSGQVRCEPLRELMNFFICQGEIH
jgi:geranylgeranyl pyrophosphate synthase